MFNYGIVQYAWSNYVVTPETITEGSIEFDTEKNLYAIKLKLEAVGASQNIVTQMDRVSGTKASYEGQPDITFIVYCEEDFTLRQVYVNETYKVDAGSIGGIRTGNSSTTDYFFYAGEEGFIGMTEDEKYDLNDKPVEQNAEEIKEIKDALSQAMGDFLLLGAKSDLTLKVNDTTIAGELQLKLDKGTKINLKTSIGEKEASIDLQKLNGKYYAVIFYDGIKLSYDLDSVGE